ncbi:beta-ketoacyl synthase [Halioglobus japonicus]|uniref:Beta-ketoacyl synthase n=1 Tax=Halioglobus japonicus TaxID=930805 RepID=A0AAP8MI85_9GAMM|nr:beta-ketoacyl synthase [Halioglobus japonicus]AQA19057.1 beta-ketoacyl synthase [Halioglobus japonicus]PLW87919.1 beta-ketoacyl synthase [Halioglobus japonicus]GHD20090.1 beta-ketoacyl-[acyl-carrier-protein] synthase FabY [Halioglobus japonicus]
MSKQRLPVIVSFGGINGAGRASGHHGVARMAYEALPEQTQQSTLASLASMMALDGAAGNEQYILDHTLIRKIEGQHFDVDAVLWNQRFPTESNGHPVNFDIETRHLPDAIPPSWKVTPTSVTHVNVNIRGHQEFLLPTARDFEVKAAGQLPTGYEPGTLYPSRSHPRGLQMTVCAASDALGNLGLNWEDLQRKVPADQISVYAGSAMGQLDSAGAGGMLKARYNGKRVTSKYCPLSLAEMPSDFINAYILGTMGATGATLGACASFLYNMRMGIADIRAGRARVAFIGSAEAPINAEVMEGYAAMGALATDKELRALDGLASDSAPDHRRACRPFAENCGFTIAESAQMIVLFDDELAMELGATVFGAATDVFVNADGYKKSISGPGVGNYITMAKATAAARAIVGENALRTGGIVQAHGTGTPQNRTSESEILSRVAEAFGIEQWPVAALKSYLGHSLGAASGDQVTSTLGMWHHGIIPGINTIDGIADDVAQDHLAFSRAHREFDASEAAYAVINSKGFGGNNASATMLSPSTVRNMLKARYSKAQWQAYEAANEVVRETQQGYDAGMTNGTIDPVYRFDHGVLQDGDVELDGSRIVVGGYEVSLDLESPYEDMTL